MKPGDVIQINNGLDVYDIVYNAATVAAAAAARRQIAAAAQSSRGLGRVVTFDGAWAKVKWLKEKHNGWYYYTTDIEKSFHVIENTNIINILYGVNK